MIDYEKADLAVIKALSRAALTLEEVEELSKTDRGAGGFGSTGS